jgi:hypothetical protein
MPTTSRPNLRWEGRLNVNRYCTKCACSTAPETIEWDTKWPLNRNLVSLILICYITETYITVRHIMLYIKVYRFTWLQMRINWVHDTNYPRHGNLLRHYYLQTNRLMFPFKMLCTNRRMFPYKINLYLSLPVAVSFSQPTVFIAF